MTQPSTQHGALVLHGANGSAAEMQPLSEALRPFFAPVRAMSLLGHGGRPLPERFSTKAFAEDVVAALDAANVERTHIVGYSTGGYVGLYLARHFPARVAGVAAIATKYAFDSASITHWVRLAQPERLRRRGGARLADLERFQAPQSWEDVTLANARYFEDLGRDPPLSDADLARIATPVMLVSSNRDAIVPWSEMRDLARLLPRAHLAMFYGSAHPLASVPVLSVARAIGQWASANP